MTRYQTLFSSVLVASSLGLLAAPVIAARQDCGPGEGRGELMGHHGKQMEQHHKKLQTALKLTPAQEEAWKKLLDSEMPMVMSAPMKPDGLVKLTTPERAEKMLERMKEKQLHQAEHVAALKEFYAVLTPEQQKSFDAFHSEPKGGKHVKPKDHSLHSAKPPAKP